MDMNLEIQQRQQLSQSQIQSLEILSMDNMELNQLMKNEYLENPLMDHNEKSVGENIFAREENGRTKELRAPQENVISDYILSQLDMKLYSRQEWQLFSYLTGCLDDSGFFTMPPEEVSQKLHVPERMVHQSLSVLKGLEPYGVFSANIQECLLCQLDALDMNSEILTCMVCSHLQDIADGKISNISRSLHVPTVEVRKSIEIISHLNPRPLSGFHTGNSSYIIPDIIFKKEDGEWTAVLNDNWIENYHLNDYYIKMMNSSKDEELTEYFRARLARVNFIFQSIEQRRKTILAVSNIIMEKQKEFLEGRKPLAPMTMTEVADIAGIHTSTVSRALKGKYLQYPNGSTLIKNLFTAPVSRQEEGNITPMLVKQYLKKFIASEDSRKPYSDQMLVNLLKEEDIRLSRRAVAKYREEMGIKGSFERRAF